MADFTDQVLEYQRTKNEKILLEIQRGVRNLIYGMLRKYGMGRYPLVIIEDIVENCRTTKLLSAINTYDPNRGAKFETHYSWYLRSECTWKKKYYLRRLNLEFTPNESIFMHPENIIMDNSGVSEQSLTEDIEVAKEEDKIEEPQLTVQEETDRDQYGNIDETKIQDSVLTSDWQSYTYQKKALHELFNCR